MDVSVFLNFLVNNLLFSFTIVLVSFVLGWILYNKIVTRGICLRDSLFEKDNLAAWVEFIGAFIYPTLYLAAKAIEGSASENLWMDLLICTAYTIGYIAVFTVLRLLSSLVVRLIGAEDENGKVHLNKEIYEQKNISAALFSVALSTIFANIVRFADVDPEFLMVTALRVSTVIILTLAALIIYIMILGRRTTLFKEVFIDNNIAAGAAFLGFVFAVETILSNSVALHLGFNFLELVGVSFISLAIFGALSAIFKVIFTKLIKVDIWNEVYEQNNIGAALGQIALYVGIANVIVHFMK